MKIKQVSFQLAVPNEPHTFMNIFVYFGGLPVEKDSALKEIQANNLGGPQRVYV